MADEREQPRASEWPVLSPVVIASILSATIAAGLVWAVNGLYGSVLWLPGAIVVVLSVALIPVAGSALWRRRPWAAVSIGSAGWAVLAAVVGGAAVAGLTWLFGPVVGLPAVAVLSVLTAVFAIGMAAAARRRAAAVLGYLRQAVQLDQPLAPLLAAAEATESGKTADRLAALRAELAGGRAVAAAVASAVPEVSAATVGRLAFAEAIGRLPAALVRSVVDEGRDGDDDSTGGSVDLADVPRRENRAFARVYPAAVLLTALAAVALIQIFAAPKLQMLLSDMRGTYRHHARPANDAGGGWFGPDMIGITLPVLGAVVVAMALFARLGVLLNGAQPGGRSWGRGAWDAVRWRWPVWGAMHRDRAMAELCHAVADGLEQGLPLDRAVRETARLNLNRVLARRAAAWADRLERGQPPAAAATAAGLPGLVAGLLSVGGDAAAPLRFAARFHANRLRVRRALLASVYVPIVTALLGIVVAAVALSVVLPLRELIERTNPYPGAM